MKLVFFVAALPAVVALQGGYLSQLNTGTYEGVNSGNSKAPGGSYFFPDPAETTKSVYVEKPPSTREIPDGHVSLLNRGTYEGINGKAIGGAAFFPDPAEATKSAYAGAPPSARETPDGYTSLLNRGTYEGINSGKVPGGAFFFPDPAETTTRDVYTNAAPTGAQGKTYARYPSRAVPPPVVAPPPPQPTYAMQQSAPAAPAPQPTTTAVGPSQELVELWSNQVSVELAASQLYLSASIWFRAQNMDGMAACLLDESGEERDHGLAILEFAMKSKFPVQLQALEAPKSDWQTPAQVWESLLHAEQTNTQNLLKLANVANQCGLFAAMAFLDPFHAEQREAEDKVGAILAKVRTGTPQLLMELDHQLGLEAQEESHH